MQTPSSTPAAAQGTAAPAAEPAAAAAAPAAANQGAGAARRTRSEEVAAFAGRIPRSVLYDIIKEMQGLVQENETELRQLLRDNPDLTRMIFQGEIMLGMLQAHAADIQATGRMNVQRGQPATSQGTSSQRGQPSVVQRSQPPESQPSQMGQTSLQTTQSSQAPQLPQLTSILQSLQQQQHQVLQSQLGHTSFPQTVQSAQAPPPSQIGQSSILQTIQPSQMGHPSVHQTIQPSQVAPSQLGHTSILTAIQTQSSVQAPIQDPTSMLPSASMPMFPFQPSMQQSALPGFLPTQHPSLSVPQPSQVLASTQYANLPSHFPVVAGHLQRPSGFNQLQQPPLPPVPRPPSAQSVTHQIHLSGPNSLGLTPGGAANQMMAQPFFHSGGNHQASSHTGLQSLPGQPAQQMYQAPPSYGGEQTMLGPQASRLPTHFPHGHSDGGGTAGVRYPGQMQMIPGQMGQGGFVGAAGSSMQPPMQQLPNIAGHQMQPGGGSGSGIQPSPASLSTVEMETVIQQVMSFTPEQIMMMPLERRQQVLQLREMLRQ